MVPGGQQISGDTYGFIPENYYLCLQIIGSYPVSEICLPDSPRDLLRGVFFYGSRKGRETRGDRGDRSSRILHSGEVSSPLFFLCFLFVPILDYRYLSRGDPETSL